MIKEKRPLAVGISCCKFGVSYSHVEEDRLVGSRRLVREATREAACIPRAAWGLADRSVGYDLLSQGNELGKVLSNVVNAESLFEGGGLCRLCAHGG